MADDEKSDAVPSGILIDGVDAVWSPDFYSWVKCCPSRCDDDCELTAEQGCHEWHQITVRRDHDPQECERRQRTQIAPPAPSSAVLDLGVE